MKKQMPKVGVGVIVMKDGKSLFLRRTGTHGEGTWCFPGGHLEFNESLEDCARREVMEESGIKIRNIRFAGLTNDIFKEENKHYITIFMAADWDSGEAKILEREKCTDIGWFGWNELPEPLFLPIQNLVKQGTIHL
ncbi:MAG: NUDIX domain-containing protein [Candidatus Aenigmarchaeota archaeon]|nr:NUDIX domain-containing protein [Candidatus Aenigmarchaeota archaeon]